MRIANNETLVEKVWGGRSLERLFGKKLPKGKLIGECWLYCGKVVVKLLDVRKPLSVQVHPKGKNEVWYVIEAGHSTKVLGGFTLEEYSVKRGDWIYIPSGTVHTILPPAVILEVSQNYLVTYRLYDWGRGTRPLDLEKGLKAVNLTARPTIYRNIDSFSCPYFNIKLEKGDGFKTKAAVYAGDNKSVFSVSWITKSSKMRRSSIV